MKKSALLLTLILSILTASFALGAFTPAEWERMKKGEIIVEEITVRNPDGSSRVQFQARAFIKASRQDVWKILRDYNKFAEFMPKLTMCQIVDKKGELYTVHYQLKVLAINVSYYLKVDGVEPFKKIVFNLDMSKPHDIKASSGYWILDDAPDGSGTVITYSTQSDTGIPAPEMITKKIGKSALTDVVKNVRLRVESGGTWKKPQGA